MLFHYILDAIRTTMPPRNLFAVKENPMGSRGVELYEELVQGIYYIDDPRQQLDVLGKYKRLIELEQELIASGAASHADRVVNDMVDIKTELENL